MPSDLYGVQQLREQIVVEQVARAKAEGERDEARRQLREERDRHEPPRPEPLAPVTPPSLLLGPRMLKPCAQCGHDFHPAYRSQRYCAACVRSRRSDATRRNWQAKRSA